MMSTPNNIERAKLLMGSVGARPDDRIPIELGGVVRSLPIDELLRRHAELFETVTAKRTGYQLATAEWGWLMVQVKKHLGRGNFLPFLKSVQVHEKQAQRAMAIAEDCVVDGKFLIEMVPSAMAKRSGKRKSERKTTHVSDSDGRGFGIRWDVRAGSEPSKTTHVSDSKSATPLADAFDAIDPEFAPGADPVAQAEAYLASLSDELFVEVWNGPEGKSGAVLARAIKLGLIEEKAPAPLRGLTGFAHGEKPEARSQSLAASGNHRSPEAGERQMRTRAEQMTLDSDYAMAERVRGVAAMVEAGGVSGDLRARLVAVLAEIEGSTKLEIRSTK